jgi:hypothetical protein
MRDLLRIGKLALHFFSSLPHIELRQLWAMGTDAGALRVIMVTR